MQDFLLGFLFRASNECEFLSKFQDSCKIVICAKSKVDLGFITLCMIWMIYVFPKGWHLSFSIGE